MSDQSSVDILHDFPEGTEDLYTQFKKQIKVNGQVTVQFHDIVNGGITSTIRIDDKDGVQRFVPSMSKFQNDIRTDVNGVFQQSSQILIDNRQVKQEVEQVKTNVESIKSDIDKSLDDAKKEAKISADNAKASETKAAAEAARAALQIGLLNKQFFPPSATDPTGPDVNLGDYYYNTSLNKILIYSKVSDVGGGEYKWLELSPQSLLIHNNIYPKPAIDTMGLTQFHLTILNRLEARNLNILKKAA